MCDSGGQNHPPHGHMDMQMPFQYSSRRLPALKRTFQCSPERQVCMLLSSQLPATLPDTGMAFGQHGEGRGCPSLSCSFSLKPCSVFSQLSGTGQGQASDLHCSDRVVIGIVIITLSWVLAAESNGKNCLLVFISLPTRMVLLPEAKYTQNSQGVGVL